MSTGVKKIDAMKMDNLEVIVEKVVCSITNKDFMFGECNKCKTKTLYKFVNKDDLDQEVELLQWAMTSEKRTIKIGKR
jgi:GH24 family phage-related lysozyme (muramidase)